MNKILLAGLKSGLAGAAAGAAISAVVISSKGRYDAVDAVCNYFFNTALNCTGDCSPWRGLQVTCADDASYDAFSAGAEAADNQSWAHTNTLWAWVLPLGAGGGFILGAAYGCIREMRKPKENLEPLIAQERSPRQAHAFFQEHKEKAPLGVDPEIAYGMGVQI